MIYRLVYIHRHASPCLRLYLPLQGLRVECVDGWVFELSQLFATNHPFDMNTHTHIPDSFFWLFFPGYYYPFAQSSLATFAGE